MSTSKNRLWCERHRPKHIDQYVFQNEAQRAQVQQMIDSKSIPHILLSGTVGSGKTTLACILIEAMELSESDVLIINASDENSVETIRYKIKDFVSTAPMGEFKIVLLEEADYITLNGQGAMRMLIEEYSDTARFILTCNYVHKLLPAIQSRCTVKYNFKAISDRDDIAEYLVQVLVSEGISFDLDLLDKYITIGYPDIRSIIGMLQQYSVNKILLPPPTEQITSDYRLRLIDLIEADNWVEARTIVCASVLKEEYEDVYRFIYEHLKSSPKFQTHSNWEEAIIIIADHLYKHASFSDPEINFSAMMIRLGAI
jgi:DNA polymerase III delta prime subunit